LTKIHLAPYINFQGHAREAMEHYHKVLGGKLGMFASDEQGRPKPAAPGDRIMYARVESDGIVIIA
jgi:PhnB protein